MGAIASEVPSSSPACGWPLSQDSCPGSGHSVHVGGGRKNGKEARGAAGLPKTPTPSPHLWASASPVPPPEGGSTAASGGPWAPAAARGHRGRGGWAPQPDGASVSDSAREPRREEPRGRGTSPEEVQLRFRAHEFNIFKNWQNPTSIRLTQPSPPILQISLRRHLPSFYRSASP